LAATVPPWSDDDTSESFETRWAAWQNQRVARDVRTRRRLMIAGVVGGLATLGWVAGVMLRG
jgi:hypothetical protein